MKHHTASRLWPLLLCVWGAYLLLRPQSAAAAVADGLSLCARSVIPALFPFFVCTELLHALGMTDRLANRLGRPLARLLHVSDGGAAVWVVGVLGGYPAGAQCAASSLRAGTLSRREAEHLNRFCNHAGPAMILSLCGMQLFGTLRGGILLWGTHVAASLLLGILLRPAHAPSARAQSTPSTPPPFAAAFTKAVKTAGSVILQVCMFVVTFSVLCALLQTLLPPQLPPLLCAAVCGMMELTNGLYQLHSAAQPIWCTAPLCAFLLGFGGLGVSAQVAAIAQDAGLSMRGYLPCKFLHGLLSAALTLPVLPLFGAPAAPLLPSVILCALAAGIFLTFRKLMSGNLCAERV